MKQIYLCIFFSLSYFYSCFAQAPHISYQTPQTYTVNTIITPLIPTNTGGAVPATAYGGTSTYAGNGSVGSTNGLAANASFNSPTRLGLDKSGNLYIADRDNNLIRKISGGMVTTLASGFNQPNGVYVDLTGNVYVADAASNSIKKITPAGAVTLLAGGDQGSNNGTGSGAKFYHPYSLVGDAAGNLYVSDNGNNLIRKVTPAGVVTTFAGNNSPSYIDNAGTAAAFNLPDGITIDAAGNLYVSDSDNNRIRKITPAAVVSTAAGNGTRATTNGNTATASFNNPAGVAIDAIGNIYVADLSGNTIRKIDASGIVTTLAGSGSAGLANGIGTAASFNRPNDVQVDPTGSVYVTDYGNNTIRKIYITGYAIDKSLPPGLTFDPTTGTISGKPTTTWPTTIYTVTAYNIAGSSSTTVSITVKGGIPPDISYQTPQLYAINKLITPLAPTNKGGEVPATVYGQVSTFAGNGISASVNGTGVNASFNRLYSIAIDAAGNFYVADYGNHKIRKITPAAIVSTFAGNGSQGAGNGPAASASFNNPGGVALDIAGNVYVGDQINNMIRKITPAGIVSTYAGTGQGAAINGPALNASFKSPAGLVFDSQGNLYVADRNNSMIRKITPAGIVSTFAGSGAVGATNGRGVLAAFSDPSGLAVDANDNIYVADGGNSLIRKITPAGVVTTFAGSGSQGSANGTGALASFNKAFDLTIDALGDAYVADEYNQLIRKITPDGVVTLLAGSGAVGAVDGVGNTASFNYPAGIVPDGLGNLFIAESVGSTVRKIIITGYNIDKALPPGLSFDAKTGIISGTPTTTFPATIYTISAYNLYGSSTTTVSIQVNYPPLIITANNQTRIYGIANPALTVKYTGFIAGDDASKLTTQPTITTTATSLSPVSTYPITASGASSANYSITYVPGTLTITVAPRTLTFNPIPNKSINDTDFDPGATINTNDPITYTSSDTSIAVIINGKIHIKKTGTVIITATVATKANYATVAPKTQILSILANINDIVNIHPVVTPNGDGINDVLLIDGIKNYPDNRLTVVNVNGIKVFEVDGYDNATHVFDGHSSITGAFQPQGTYFYSLQFKVNGESKKRVGYVILKY